MKYKISLKSQEIMRGNNKDKRWDKKIGNGWATGKISGTKISIDLLT
jgi:hypothetical protein